MATPVIQHAFVSGELAPEVYGRVDVDREHVAATTMRNMFVDVRGGAKSRAGTAFVGFSKQTGRSYPPRLIPFQASLNQGRCLEFGHQYMRVIYRGGYVTETPVSIGSATKASPCVLGFGTDGATVAVPIVTGVTAPYAPGDLVTLDGGTYLSPAVLEVTASQLVSILPKRPGSGYTVADTVTLGGGTSSVAAVATVATVVAVAASGDIVFTVNPSDGDTVTMNGVAFTFKGTPGSATDIQIEASLAATLINLATTLNASANASVNVATYSSDATTLYVVYDTTGVGGNAYTLAASAATVSGATLTGGATDGIGTLTISTPGVYTALPTNYEMSQSATSGGGTGASFQTAVFGPQALTVSAPGAYTATPGNPVSQASTDGIGVGATFTMTWGAVAPFSNGDWLYVSGCLGMTELNGNTYVVAGATATTVNLTDVYGNPVDSSGFGTYLGGGTVARIYTATTPYNEKDLRWLKYTQSKDVMTLCCVNQDDETEYAPEELTRISDTDWSFSEVIPAPSTSPPGNVVAQPTAPGTTYYRYAVTSIDPDDGSESRASDGASTVASVDIGETLGQINLTWVQVEGVNQYNIYKAQPSYASPVPDGSLMGYIGTTFGGKFADTNIIPDFTQTPPYNKNPFARGAIAGVRIVSAGSGYTSATAIITSGTGSGAVLSPVVLNGQVVAVLVIVPGAGYVDGDTVTLVGDGAGATAQLVVGPQSGTYPSVPAYFQQRRVFANSLNYSDTYWMSQPGMPSNFDSRIPPIDSDAITGNPWSQQVNGVQWMLQTSGGLLVLTGLSAWLLAGAGSFATNVQALAPSNQNNVPQAFTGVSPSVAPVRVNYDVLYLDGAGSTYYALPYQLYVLSEPIDLTEMSPHLFRRFTILDSAWCEEPFKINWAVRSDGVLLSLTYYKSQAVAGWARHDTQGTYESLCAVREPPTDVLYLATKRIIGVETAYMVERMDERIWDTVEQAWCVDCGLTLALETPNATLTVDLPNGLGAISGFTDLVGGSGYSTFTTVQIVDDNGGGPGTGADIDPVIAGGVITGFTINAAGTGYVRPKVVITDPTNAGRGATATAILDTSATFTASVAVFSAGNVGDVIRMGNGVAEITAYIGTQSVTATVKTPITDFIPNTDTPRPAPAGKWTLSTPVSTITGLDHLTGAEVTGLADGKVVTPRTVSANGTITLDEPASLVTIGLAFVPQLQGVYLDAGAPTVQGQRKKAAAVNVLLNSSLGVKAGGAQPDGASQNPPQLAPTWADLVPLQALSEAPYNSDTVPLYTGYNRAPVQGGFNKTGQVALQQDYPWPMEILALVSEVLEGDTPEQNVREKNDS